METVHVVPAIQTFCAQPTEGDWLMLGDIPEVRLCMEAITTLKSGLTACLSSLKGGEVGHCPRSSDASISTLIEMLLQWIRGSNCGVTKCWPPLSLDLSDAASVHIDLAICIILCFKSLSAHAEYKTTKRVLETVSGVEEHR